MNYKKNWESGISFETYFKDSQKKLTELANSTNEQNIEFHNYYKLGISRTKRLIKNFKINKNQVDKLNSVNNYFFLVISESWCGDASQVLPAMHCFFPAEKLKILYRDKNEELMMQFLTNGAKAIPIVLILDENFNLKKTWGPRGKNATKILLEHKAKDTGFDKDLFYKDLQSYYVKNNGDEVINEILELL